MNKAKEVFRVLSSSLKQTVFGMAIGFSICAVSFFSIWVSSIVFENPVAGIISSSFIATFIFMVIIGVYETFFKGERK